jgi:benzoate/toluate 1,2-dioxygenase alpha subunit
MTTGPWVLDDRETPRFRVNRQVMVDPDLLDSERDRIFDRCWLYVGHESEIPSPHDFRTRKVGGRGVIFLGDSNGDVRVFVNSCPHRGTEVETRPEGHGRFLKCFYHGWSFNTEGRLVALPDEASYGPDFDRENLCLPCPPRVGSYQGLVFLAWTADVVDLETYLGGACDFLDLVADQSEQGMRIVGGTHLYAARANWKLLAENSIDGYHAMTVHHRYLQMLVDDGVDMGARFGSDGPPTSAHDLGHGHAVIAAVDNSQGRMLGGLGRDFPTERAEAKHLQRRARLVELHGEEWTNRILGSRNLILFPNTVVIDLVMGATIRTFYPEAPDCMEVTGWQIQPVGEDPELHRMRMDNFLTFWGPAGLATPDDLEALERCQLGYRAYQATGWNDMSRGMTRVPNFTDEFQMRVWWRRWNELMTDEAPLTPEQTPYHRRVHQAVTVR